MFWLERKIDGVTYEFVGLYPTLEEAKNGAENIPEPCRILQLDNDVDVFHLKDTWSGAVI